MDGTEVGGSVVGAELGWPVGAGLIVGAGVGTWTG